MSDAERALLGQLPQSGQSSQAYTWRVTTITLAVAAAATFTLLALTDGPRPATETDIDAYSVTARSADDGVYIGYPPELYDARGTDRYDPAQLGEAVLTWRAAHPDARVSHVEPVAIDGVLIGYRVHVVNPQVLG